MSNTKNEYDYWKTLNAYKFYNQALFTVKL
jgi:hypothetical protein